MTIKTMNVINNQNNNRIISLLHKRYLINKNKIKNRMIMLVTIITSITVMRDNIVMLIIHTNNVNSSSRLIIQMFSYYSSSNRSIFSW
jgi:hypothetical protein